MKVLADLHHSSLYESLRILIEDRLGGELYRPIGYDWYDEGYFRIAEPYGNAPDTIKQYLDINHDDYDPLKNLNGDHYKKGEVYFIKDHFHDSWHKAITLKTFKEMEFDIILPSHPLHEATWVKLRDNFHPKAKVIHQYGNEAQIPDYSVVKNILCSTLDFQPPKGVNFVRYHQEFKTEYFRTEPIQIIPLPKTIRSFFNYPQYTLDVPGFKVEMFGNGTDNGPVSSIMEMGQKMQEAQFGLHLKPADGYGHVWHNFYAAGRPVITYGSYYKGKMGGLLFEDGVTGVDIEGLPPSEVVSKLRRFSHPHTWEHMSINALNRFNEICDFDKEEKKIRSFLDRLI